MFKEAGADLIDCSSGQVSKEERPVYGRLFQTPFADQIRNEAQIATIAVGAISEADHANSILAAGRADLCAIARPHLGRSGVDVARGRDDRRRPIAWPKQYAAAKGQYEANLARAAAAGAEANERGFAALGPSCAGHRRGRRHRRGDRARAWRRRARGQPCRSPARTAGRSGGLASGRSGAGRRRLRRHRREGDRARARSRARGIRTVSILVNNAGEAPSASFERPTPTSGRACARGRSDRRL